MEMSATIARDLGADRRWQSSKRRSRLTMTKTERHGGGLVTVKREVKTRKKKIKEEEDRVLSASTEMGGDEQ